MTAATLAVAWAQAFGIHRGWLCDCGDTLRLTLVDHCHGPHSSACHDNDEHDLPHHHEEDDEESHEHTAVVEDLLGKQHEVSTIHAPVLVAQAATELEVELFTPYLDGQCRGKPPDKGRRDGLREWPQILTRTIVLRV
jgi:hypothetical protein